MNGFDNFQLKSLALMGFSSSRKTPDPLNLCGDFQAFTVLT